MRIHAAGRTPREDRTTTQGTRTAAILTLAAFAFVGCGDDGTGPGGSNPGSGSVQVTGAISLSFSGTAVSGTDALTGLTTFAVSISSTDATNDADIVFKDGRPAPGTYTIGDPDADVYAELGIGSTLYESVSGEVTISSSSGQSISGTTSFSARRLGGQEQVNVTASFNAVCIEVPGLITCP